MQHFDFQIKPCLTKLNDDADFDVRYYASEAALGETAFEGDGFAANAV